MKSFHEQYCECEKSGFHVLGKVEKFKDHPEMLPSPWNSISPKIVKKLKDNPDFGLTPVMCLRFGGQCSSKNFDCKKMRELKKKNSI